MSKEITMMGLDGKTEVNYKIYSNGKKYGSVQYFNVSNDCTRREEKMVYNHSTGSFQTSNAGMAAAAVRIAFDL